MNDPSTTASVVVPDFPCPGGLMIRRSVAIALLFISITAIIAIQAADLNEVVTIHQDALNEVAQHDGSSAKLHLGDQLTLKDLLYALMLPSGDDAAIAIADAVGGSTANFVNMMNLFAYR